MKLDQMILIAQAIEYKKPTKNETEWTNNEIIFSAINDALQNPVQISAIKIFSKSLTPVNVAIKRYLEEYIKLYKI